MNYFCKYFKNSLTESFGGGIKTDSMQKKTQGEFDWIGQIRERFSGLVPAGTEGIGDDCAVIPTGGGESLVVTTDMLVEDVHFVRQKISPEQLGHKSLAVNLSDVAAMGAEPRGSFLSIGLPACLDEAWRDSFLTGYQTLSKQYGVPLLGGDTTASDKLVVNVTAIGNAPNTHLKRRSGAKPGDLICVTGNLGDSAAGLRLLLAKDEFSTDEQTLVDTHYCPKPFVHEGVWLGGQPAVHAMMDVSDGIASDLVHIVKASGVSARVELAQLPLSAPLQRVCAEQGWNPQELAASGGEDYVLLLTADALELTELNKSYHALFGHELTVIGQIVSGEPAIVWLNSGEPAAVEWKGFSHF